MLSHLKSSGFQKMMIFDLTLALGYFYAYYLGIDNMASKPLAMHLDSSDISAFFNPNTRTLEIVELETSFLIYCMTQWRQSKIE